MELRNSGENLHIRMTYHQGTLEMMAPSKRHEHFGYFLGRLIDVWTEERNIDVQSCRTMTFRREDLQCGFEPDNCYYIAHEAAIRNKDELDLSFDPPPDLAVEIDLSGSALDNLEIYAAFRVPEVWRYDGENLFIHLLGADGKYEASPNCNCLPGLPIREIEDLMQKLGSASDTELIRQFRRLVQLK
jgi:Uma2 family endonuclease